MKNRSVMTHAFSRVPTVSVPRSVFNRSSGHKTTFDAGYLIPMWVDEALPGDSINMRSTVLLRLLSASLRPFMDNLWVDTFWFFVPNRLLWLNFQKFMGEQTNPGDSISFLVPTVTSPNVAGGGIAVGSLFDYMGLPTGPLNGGGSTTGITFNNLHGRAYNLIYNQWFRDENMIPSVPVSTGDGPDTYTDYVLLRRGKRHDYFTSCLPFLQKGTAVPLPLGTLAPVTSTGAVPNVSSASLTNSQLFAGVGTQQVLTGGAATATETIHWGSVTGLQADLSTATAATVNSLRSAIALQQLLENDARGGTRYIEILKAHFGVTSPDARLQRPELLSTFSTALKLNPVANTASTTAGTNYQGTLSGFGTSVQSGQGFTKSFVEHGVIIGLISVRADLTYQQGMDRMWSRRTRYDYFWPELANLGEQSVLNREVYANLADGTSGTQKDGVFGYIPRYDEYRFKNSKITGLLRSTASGTLDIWHLSQDFSTQPVLDGTFISEDPPVDRVIAVPSEPHFIMDAFFDCKSARPMPVFAVPGLHKL